MDEQTFLAEEIKDIRIKIGAANLILQKTEDLDELKVILSKGKQKYYNITQKENKLNIIYNKNKRGSREEIDEIIVRIPENKQFENMSVSIGAGKLTAENITVMERLELEVGAGNASLCDIQAEDVSIECGVGKCDYEGRIKHNLTVECGVGQVKLALDAKESDYNYKVSCALGKVKMNDHAIGTFISEKTIQNPDAKGTVALECGLGTIDIKTKNFTEGKSR